MEFVHVELKRENWIQPEINVNSPEEAVEAVQTLIEDLDREVVICIHLATTGRVISAEICNIGTIDKAIIQPAQIIRTAILTGASNMILVHNHPSGNCEPSKDDLSISQKIATICCIVGIPLLDFIVLGSGEKYSFKEKKKRWIQPQSEWLS